ncbi:YbaK/EbsC family protein, partial [Streptococcus pyogenes]
LILANKKSTQFYMIIMDDAKQVDMNRLSEILEVKRLHFISEDRLEEMLGLNSGIVSLFGLVGTNYENMNIYFDQQMLDD